MDKKKILLKDIAKVDPFVAPEGYFEIFMNGIMSQLPVVVHQSKTVNLWQQARPWIYMAAMFAGFALMLRLFVGSPASLFRTKNYATEGLKLTSSSDIDDFYHFYEEGLARLAYDDAIYPTDYEEDENNFLQ